MPEFISVSRDGPLTTITINRPVVANAMHAEAQFEMDAAFDEFAEDRSQWVAILTGAGDKAFCAGGDLKALNRDGVTLRPKTGFGGLTARFDLDKPVIAAVNGLAMGGGFELALACDLILAAERATFALSEPRVGLAALGGGLQRLAEQIGSKRALGLALTARTVSAREGQALGFVNEVFDNDDLVPAAIRLGRAMCELAPLALRASKEVVYRSLEEPSLFAAFKAQRHYPAVKRMLDSEDFREGPRAFAEKRPPRWKAR